MDGFEMTRRLRSLEDFQETPIIASSASVFEFDRQKSQLAGYDDFLPKPIQTDELLHKLAMYLKLSWIQDEPLEVAIAPPASDAEIILPPATELVNLYEAAQIGHIERVIQEATRLQSLNADYAPFSARILALADQFDDVAIIQLIEPHLHPS
jgi:response regulator RpfG family c-di-GMP phosphodiesterase